jgi:hypothetical protein
MGPAPSRPRAGPGFRSRRRDARRATRGRCHRPRRHVPSNLNRAIPKRLVASSGCGEPAASSGGKRERSLVARMLTALVSARDDYHRGKVFRLTDLFINMPGTAPVPRGDPNPTNRAAPHREPARARRGPYARGHPPFIVLPPSSLSNRKKNSFSSRTMNTHPRLEQSARRRHRVLLTASPAHPPCSAR